MELNVTAPFNRVSYGISSLGICRALDRLGHKVSVWPIGGVDVEEEHFAFLNAAHERARFFNRNAPSLRIYHQFSLDQHVGKGPHCAMPIFELDKFKPVELHHLEAQDLLFVNSEWAADVLAANGVAVAVVAPLGIDHAIFAPDPYDMKPALEKTICGHPTVFLNVGKWEVRKGHDVLLEAFNKAFTPRDNVKLIMHAYNPCFRTQEECDRYNGQWVAMYKNSPMGEKIKIVEGRLDSQHGVANLMRHADCGVFPSRAEGFNLPAAEMMAMGKRIILTNYSAHTQFANADNAFLIDIDKLEDAHDGVWFRADDPAWPNAVCGSWAHMGESQVDQLITHLRHVHAAKQYGALEPNHAGVRTMSRFTWENTAQAIVNALGD